MIAAVAESDASVWYLYAFVKPYNLLNLITFVIIVDVRECNPPVTDLNLLEAAREFRLTCSPDATRPSHKGREVVLGDEVLGWALHEKSWFGIAV